MLNLEREEHAPFTFHSIRTPNYNLQVDNFDAGWILYFLFYYLKVSTSTCRKQRDVPLLCKQAIFYCFRKQTNTFLSDVPLILVD